MKNQPIVLLVIAAGCGLIAMLGVKQAISRKGTDTVPMVQVLSATVEIRPGEHLTELNTKFINVAASSVPEGAVQNMEEVEERALTVPVTAGDWILKNKLGEKGQVGAEATIPPGMGIVTIPVDATTSHSGMLRPGNRIDLLLTFSDTSSGVHQQKTITVLEFVEVFAVDNHVYGIDKNVQSQAKNITLLVSPQQGKAVTLAGRIGTLSTMMRARGDSGSDARTEISQEFLTSSFSGNNLHAPSVMDLREEYVEGEEYYDGETEESEQEQMDSEVAVTAGSSQSDWSSSESPSMDELLAREVRTGPKDPGGSGPVQKQAANKNTWTMEIYQGDTLRVESIEIAEAVETPGSWSLWDMWKSE
jgi:pilus assembly protein CpaB